MAYRVKSNDVYHNLAEINDVSEWDTSNNGVTVVLWKFANVVSCRIQWVGSASTTNKFVSTGITIPSGFKPSDNVYAEARSFANNQVINDTVTRYQIGKDGSLNYITNESGYVERIITVTWLTIE